MKKSQNKLFEGQHDNEDLLLVFRSHPVRLRRPLIAFLLVLLLAFTPIAIWPLSAWAWNFLFFGSSAAVIVFLYFWIGWYYSIYIITDERLIEIKQKGLFSRKVVELGLDKIQNANYEVSGLQETLLKYGTITIQTFVGDLMLEQIPHPARIHSEITEILREHTTDKKEEEVDEQEEQQ